MSYRLRGEICVDVEDHQYEIDIEVNGPEGIAELMSENNVTTAELVDYQNDYGTDEYRPEITDANIGDYIGGLDNDGVADLAERCIRTLNARYKAKIIECNDVRSDNEALKLKLMPTNDNTSQHSTTTCPPASN